MINTSSLSRSFQSLPETIKNWLVSETVTDIILSINISLYIEGKNRKKLGNSIIFLITGSIDARNMINELGRELRINFNTARSVAQQIYDQILKPIDTELRALGVDARQIIDYSATPDPSLSTFGSTSSLTTKNFTNETSVVDFRQAPAPIDIIPPSIAHKNESDDQELTPILTPQELNQKIPPSFHEEKGIDVEYSTILDRLNTKIKKTPALQTDLLSVNNSHQKIISPNISFEKDTERVEKEKVINQVLKSRLLTPPTTSPSNVPTTIQRPQYITPPDNLPVASPPLASAPQKPLILHREMDDLQLPHPSQENHRSFQYVVPEQYQRKTASDEHVTVEIEGAVSPLRTHKARLVHYCVNLTPFHQATIPLLNRRRDSIQKEKEDNQKHISLPHSRWFKS